MCQEKVTSPVTNRIIAETTQQLNTYPNFLSFVASSPNKRAALLLKELVWDVKDERQTYILKYILKKNQEPGGQ